MKGEGLQVLDERMKIIDPDENKIYKFLEVEQADGNKKKEVYNRVKEEISRRMNIITRTELNDKNPLKAINTKAIPVAAYPMNICKFTQSGLTELDQIIKIFKKEQCAGTRGKRRTIVHEKKKWRKRT